MDCIRCGASMKPSRVVHRSFHPAVREWHCPKCRSVELIKDPRQITCCDCQIIFTIPVSEVVEKCPNCGSDSIHDVPLDDSNGNGVMVVWGGLLLFVVVVICIFFARGC